MTGEAVKSRNAGGVSGVSGCVGGGSGRGSGVLVVVVGVGLAVQVVMRDSQTGKQTRQTDAHRSVDR